MFSDHPYQKSLCALFVSAVFLTYFTSLKEKIVFHNSENFSSNAEQGFLTYVNESYENIESVIKTTKHHADEEHTIYILGLFEISTKKGARKESQSEINAAKLAVEKINEENILPGYKISLLINDTKCDPGVGIDRFFHAIYSNKIIVMLLGAGCSNVSESLAHIVPYWNILQISFGSKSPTLSDRKKFPLFFRTIAPEMSHNNAKVHFIKRFGWNVVATFSQSEDAFMLPVNYLVAQLEKENISCVSMVTFSISNYRDQLKVLKDMDIRIIFGSFSSIMASKIFCTIYEFNMYGSEYVWILQDQNENWWKQKGDCSRDQLKLATEGTILVSDYGFLSEHLDKVNKTRHDIFKLTENTSSKNVEYVYDAVWAMALTLRKSRYPLRDFHYNRKDMMCTFLETMKNLRFLGASGPVKFNGADRIGNSVVRQIKGGRLTEVAVFDSTINKLDFNCTFCKQIWWQGNAIPIAQRILKKKLLAIPHSLYIAVWVISVLGICVCLMFLYFNMHFRRMKTIKLTSPRLNNLAVVGCMFVYFSVILLGWNNVNTSPIEHFGVLCSARTYLLSSGFSLTFGTMLAKTYRIHKLFIDSATTIIKDRFLQDQQLIALVLVPLLVDGLIMSLWLLIDPMERHLYDLPLEISTNERGVVYQPQVEVCSSQNTLGWFVTLFGYKSMILIMGVYMAWKTRHVKIPALNDSRYFAICVYSAVFSTAIVIISGFFSNYFILSYIAKTASILVSTTVTLFLLFLPKFGYVFSQVDAEENIMNSLGIKIEYNTKRFVSDDPRELIHRMEIQNKVYRCELQALDKEILKLEDMILFGSTTSSCKSDEKLSVAVIDIHCMEGPSTGAGRASWPCPRYQNLVPSDFLSENKLNKSWVFEKMVFFGRLKRFLGTFGSTHCDVNDENYYLRKTSIHQKPTLRSNPELRSNDTKHISKNFSKVKSETNITHLRC